MPDVTERNLPCKTASHSSQEPLHSRKDRMSPLKTTVSGSQRGWRNSKDFHSHGGKGRNSVIRGKAECSEQTGAPTVAKETVDPW